MKFVEPIWNCILQDVKRLNVGMQKSFNFFEEGSGAQSILSLSEDQIVNIIQKNKNYLNLLLTEAGIQHYSKAIKHIPKYEVFGYGTGDFDLVIYGPTYPYELISFEFKRIKVEALDYNNDKVNKIGGIETLFNQLEERVKMGFHAVYGIIIIHSDLRERRTANTILRSHTLETNQKLFYEINSLKSFPTEAGLILMKYEQPTGKESAINFKVGRVKFAEKLRQNDETRVKFQNYLNQSNFA
ncbi:hypothetical protein EHQ47_16680 [Leptospira bourretii]|uniref:hypothetical protein n=1 Tax=Leptospira bourretii TaxID=2484962 RepID=UPI001091200F|nr:hypothetical protein [Leptospira bourretii]TGL19731.1 hypothetical protein EHQ47_16680 [Leptospira bourretii]